MKINIGIIIKTKKIREKELSKNMYHKNIFIIRFNHNSYTQCKKYYASCWGSPKNNISSPKYYLSNLNNQSQIITNMTEWEYRLKKTFRSC